MSCTTVSTVLWRASLLPPHWFGCLPLTSGCTVDYPRWTCVFHVLACSWPTLTSRDGREPLLVSRVRQACPLHCCRSESLAPQAVLLFKRTDRFSRKGQLLPALVLLLAWPLLCADSRADFVHGCSHAEWGEQEELSRAAGLCLLLLWLWFNHRRAALYPSTLREGKKCPLSLSVNGT